MLISESTSDRIVQIAQEASRILLQYFKSSLVVEYKQDASPVTAADHAANHIIVTALQHLTPHIPIISEESNHHEPVGDLFWLIDPLDGTRAFVKGSPEFSINIGLIEHQQPVYGVLAVPPRGTIYVGGSSISPYKIDKEGKKHKINARAPQAEGLHVLKSSAATSEKMQRYLNSLPLASVQGMSSAMKFGLIAEGEYDLYPRFGRTMEWDTAAGHAIILSAGGDMTTMEDTPFLYNKPGFENGGFVARGFKPLDSTKE